MQNNEIEIQSGCCEDELNTGLLTVDEARARILDSVTAISDTETLPVRAALEAYQFRHGRLCRACRRPAG